MVNKRMGDQAPLFYSRETRWQEVINLKMEEYEFRIQMEILKGMPACKNEKDYAALVAKVYRDAKPDIEQLKQIAHDIRELDLKEGADLEKALYDEAEALDQWSYASPEYKDFILALEKDLMETSGYDYVGLDGMRNARAIRTEIRKLVYEYCYPIGAMPTLGTKEKQYLDYLLEQMHIVLNKAQFDAAGNTIIAGVELDRRIDEVGFRSALNFHKVQSFQEFDAAAYGAALPAVVGAAAVSGHPGAGGALDVQRTNEKIDKAAKEIEDIYDPVDDLEWSALLKSDFFDTYLDVRIARLVQEMTDAVTVGAVATPPANADTIIKT